MLSAVQFRGRDFLLDSDIDDETHLMLETCLPDVEPIPGSFATTELGNDSGSEHRFIIQESEVDEKLPFDAQYAFDPGEDGLGEVYIFFGGDRNRDELETIVLYGKFSEDDLKAQDTH